MAETTKLVKPFGDGEITLQFAGKVLKNVMATVNLSEATQDFFNIQGKNIISAAGYKKLNRIASINIISPPTLWWADKEVPNPYPIQGKEEGTIKAIIMRRIGIGFSPIGNLVIIDKSLYFNIHSYWMETLAKLASTKPVVAKLGVRYMCPFAPSEEPKEGKEGEFYVRTSENKIYLFIGMEAGTGIWLDLGHDEAIKIFKDHTQRQKFAERIGQTILDRNILKDHPAIGLQNVIPKNGYAQVNVYGWKHDLTRNDFDDLTQKAIAGEQIEGAEVQKGTVTIDEEDQLEVTEVISEETVPENGSRKEPEVPQESLFDQTAEDQAKLNTILAWAKEEGISADLTVLAKQFFPEQKLSSYRQVAGENLLVFQDKLREHVAQRKEKKGK